MAKAKSYDTEVVMREREQYPDPAPKKRSTGQTRHNRSNGKSKAGGNGEGGKK